jgi:hypothetical protein
MAQPNTPKPAVMQHPAQQVYVARISEATLQQIAKKLPKININEQTTPQQVGYQLGIQKVLEVLREEFTV